MVQFFNTVMDQAVRSRDLSGAFALERRGDALAEYESIVTATLDRDTDRSAENDHKAPRAAIRATKRTLSR